MQHEPIGEERVSASFLFRAPTRSGSVPEPIEQNFVGRQTPNVQYPSDHVRWDSVER